MKILNQIQCEMENLGFKTSEKYGPISRIIRFIAVFGLSILFYFLSPLFYLIFEAETFGEKSETSFSVMSGFLNASWQICLLWKEVALLDILRKTEFEIQKRIDEPTIALIYEKTIERTNGLFRRASSILIKIVMPAAFSLNIIASSVKYINSGYSNEAFKLCYSAWLPYDWKIPINYSITVTIQNITVHLDAITWTCVLGTFTSYCIFGIAFIQDIETSFCAIINDIASQPRSKRHHMKNKLPKIIQFHCDVKQLMIEISELLRLFVAIYLCYASITICMNLLMIAMAINAGNYVGVVSAGCITGVVVSGLYLFCNFGNDVTTRFSSLNVTIFHSPWYSMPADVQQYLRLMIVNTQKPIYMKGFANIDCTRDIFKKVVNAAFSFFNLMRQYS